jgi:hypothetical protein
MSPAYGIEFFAGSFKSLIEMQKCASVVRRDQQIAYVKADLLKILVGCRAA